MKTLLAAVLGGGLLLAGAGCVKRVPAPKPPPAPPPLRLQSVRQLGTPSPLIDPPPDSAATDRMPFDLPLNQGYGIEGSWAGPAWDPSIQAFSRTGKFTVRKGDNSDVDPKEIDAVLRAWVASSGVQSTQSERLGTYGSETRYGTARTIGTVRYRVQEEAPAKAVPFTVDIAEKPRPSR